MVIMKMSFIVTFEKRIEFENAHENPYACIKLLIKIDTFIIK